MPNTRTEFDAPQMGEMAMTARRIIAWVFAIISVILLLASATPVFAATTVTVTCTPGTVNAGQSLICIVTVTGGTPSGPVSLSTQPGSSGSIQSTQCNIGSGTCTGYPVTTGVGTLRVVATYQGDGTQGNTSSITVNIASPTTSDFCSPQSVPVGSSTTCTLQVSGGAPVDGTTITFSSLATTGRVSFPSGATCALSSGRCGVSVSAVGAGSVTIQATYPGDANDNPPATQATTPLSISKATSTTTVVCAPATVNAGQAATCTATVRGYYPTGIITWSSTDSAGIFSANPCTLTTTANSGSCGISYTATSSAQISGSYQGDGNNTGSQGSFSITANVQETIQVTVANSGPTSQVTLSGCAVSPTTIPSDGVAHTFTATSGCTGIVATLPPPGPNTQYLTASDQSSLTIPSCSSSSCRAFSATIYYQLYNTYQASPASPSSWSTAGTITVSGTALGVSGQSLCAIAVSTGAGQFSCQAWSDFDTQVTMGALQVSQNQRWATGQSIPPDASGGLVHTSSYYSQVLEEFQYSLVGSTTAPSAPRLNYTGFGSYAVLPLTGSQSLVWLDTGSGWSVPTDLAGSTAVERWEGSTSTGAATAGQTVALTYYHQFLVNFGYSVVGGGTAYVSPTVQFTSFGAALQGSQGWVDAGATYSFTNPLSGSTTSERWFTPTPSAIASASGTDSAVYYHQYAFALNFSVSGGGTYVNPRLNFTALGRPGLAQVNATSATVWIDAGAKWGVSVLLPNSSPIERWVTKQTTSGAASAPVLGAFLYYHQYLGTLQFSISGTGGSPPVPSLNYTSLTASMEASLGTTAATYWMDAGSLWVVPLTLPGVQGERWLSNATVSVANGQFVQDIQYTHQFYVEVGVSAPAAGQVANTNQWENQGSSELLNATAAKGWNFAFWQGATPSSYNGTTRLSNLTVQGPANETAIFFPGLTIVASNQGSVKYSYGTIGGTVPGGSNVTIYPPPNRNVTLTAMPATVSIKFQGWTGGVVGTQLPSELAYSLQAPISIESPAIVHATFATDYTDIRTFALASLGIFAAACFVFIVRRGYTPRRKQ